MKIARIIIPIFCILAAAAAVYWYVTTRETSDENTTLTGSGTVEATELSISPEVSGRVSEVLVSEGDQVASGDMVFKLDTTLLEAQRNQAQVNLDAARAGMKVAKNVYTAAENSMKTAQVQYDIALAQALQQAQPVRSNAWRQALPSEFDQPMWYYTHDEQLAAALEELSSAKATLEEEQVSFDSLKMSDVYSSLETIETRLAQARIAFLNAEDVVDRAKAQNNQSLIDSAQDGRDAARDELDAAQSAYDELLTTEEANEILDARAKIVVAQERYDTAQDRFDSLQTGKDSLQVQLAAATLVQAQDNVTLTESKLSQAEISIDQAQAALDLINAQMDKLTIYAPISGVVLARNIEPGEVIQAGSPALTIGDLANLTITVYLPENRYGEVKLGDQAEVSVDSFPNHTFTATVSRIADQAEFTPRNVQTMEGRSTTVYAVQLEVQNPGGLLKPGMPADVTFNR